MAIPLHKFALSLYKTDGQLKFRHTEILSYPPAIHNEYLFVNNMLRLIQEFFRSNYSSITSLNPCQSELARYLSLQPDGT